MSKSIDWEGVQGTIIVLDLGGQPGSKIGQISAERRGAAMKVEVAFGAHGVFPLPMDMEREDRCE